MLAGGVGGGGGDARAGAGRWVVEGGWDVLADGSVVTAPNPTLGLPGLSGYEFHHGRAVRGAGVAAFTELTVGVGDGPVGA